jgi:hypothetical protein
VAFAWRAVFVVAVFIGVGMAVDKIVISHQRAANAPESQVRLSAAMAGLFAGGASASILTLVLAFATKRNG